MMHSEWMRGYKVGKARARLAWTAYALTLLLLGMAVGLWLGYATALSLGV
jgi:hypothetical protein